MLQSPAWVKPSEKADASLMNYLVHEVERCGPMLPQPKHHRNAVIQRVSLMMQVWKADVTRPLFCRRAAADLSSEVSNLPCKVKPSPNFGSTSWYVTGAKPLSPVEGYSGSRWRLPMAPASNAMHTWVHSHTDGQALGSEPCGSWQLQPLHAYQPSVVLVDKTTPTSGVPSAACQLLAVSSALRL